MPAVTTTDAGDLSPANSSQGAGIRLGTFAAERYVGEELGHLVDLGDLFAPPYDVLDPASTAVLRDRHPHNVVRLTMPEGADPAARGRHALASLERWRSEGVLLRDAEPGLYVLETRQHGAASPGDIAGPEAGARPRGVTVHRGVVGLLPPPSSEDGAVLPHEDVMPGPVADRLSLLEATRLQAEPILLVHDADPTVVECVDSVTRGAPLCRATVGRTTYRLWGVSDPGWVARVQDALSRRRAFIADGHHRYATAAKLGVPVLAVLVDSAAWPLQVGAIHRSLAGVPLPDALGHLPDNCHAGPAHDAADVASIVSNLRDGALVLTDGARAVEVTWAEADAPAGGDTTVGQHSTAVSTSSGPLAAALLHDGIVPALGLVEERIGYHHDIDSAVRAARAAHGVAALLAPATAAVVREVVGRGELMPRKSTSFSPKPPSGLVMHALEP